MDAAANSRPFPDLRAGVAKHLPPVTVLCGFLGAGKTTLLNHLLGQSEGERWALVVNDVGAINVDAHLLAQQAAALAEKTGGGESQRIVELGNGCVCCSLKDDLAETVAELALTGREGGPPGIPFDHIIVETTGVAEPRGIATQFTQRNSFGRSLGDVARLQALVSVIDSAHFHRLWLEHVSRTAGAVRTVAGSGPRPLFELMIEQVEVADLLVLNKCDLLDDMQLDELEAALRGLNSHAETLRVEHGQVSREVVLDLVRFDEKETLAGAQWLKSLNALSPLRRAESAAESGSGRYVTKHDGRQFLASGGDANSDAKHERRYGLRSFVYQSRVPFNRSKLETLLQRGIPGLVRAKGFCWWSDQPDEMGFLSVAGDVMRFETLNFWWAALIENGKASLADRPEIIRALWLEPMGDRRQELVFIGVGLAESKLRLVLDECLAPAPR